MTLKLVEEWPAIFMIPFKQIILQPYFTQPANVFDSAELVINRVVLNEQKNVK